MPIEYSPAHSSSSQGSRAILPQPTNYVDQETQTDHTDEGIGAAFNHPTPFHFPSQSPPVYQPPPPPFNPTVNPTYLQEDFATLHDTINGIYLELSQISRDLIQLRTRQGDLSNTMFNNYRHHQHQLDRLTRLTRTIHQRKLDKLQAALNGILNDHRDLDHTEPYN